MNSPISRQWWQGCATRDAPSAEFRSSGSSAKSSTALKELAYGASHEINNPLANIAARAQTLLEDEPDPERRRKLTAIHRQAMRAHEMIADLMLFARPPKLELADVRPAATRAASRRRAARTGGRARRSSSSATSATTPISIAGRRDAIGRRRSRPWSPTRSKRSGADGHVNVSCARVDRRRRSLGRSDRPRRRARHLRSSPPASVRSVLQRPRGGPRARLRPVEVLADRHRPRRPGRREQRRRAAAPSSRLHFHSAKPQAALTQWTRRQRC